MEARVLPADGGAPLPPAPSRGHHWRLAVAGVAALLAEILDWSGGHESSWPVAALALLAIAASGLGTYRKGWLALKNRNLNINALMTIAVSGAVAIGQWPEAAMVMVLFALAELIEARSLDRARRAIHGLMALSPPQATVLQPDGGWRTVEVAAIVPGAIARVAPGERLALDGVLTAGGSSVDQAPITGESMPVEKTVGDAVFAGSINQTGSFEYRVTSAAGDSMLARIIHAVEHAQTGRAPTQRFVDRFARVYTPVVFVLALGVALVAPLAFGIAWSDAVYQALVLLVIACPCALVVSTPVTIVSALAAAARAGILVKGGVYLEQGKDIRALALDKTGTLTHGRPRLTDCVPLPETDAERALQLAAALAARSDHPVSAAIAAHWHELGRAAAPAVDGFAALPGRGVQGTIDGRRHVLGNHRMVEQLGLCNATVEAVLDRIEAQGKTAVVLCDEQAPLAVIGVADTLRAGSRQALDELRALGVHAVMLTGDNARTARAIADQVGLEDARGELLPEDKLAAVRELQAHYGLTAMAGDGINDAPALAQADIGFAMGAAGSDTALETADVALMDDDLRKLPAFIRLSRRTATVLKQNIAFALGIKAAFMLLALAGMATLWMAVFADMGASLLVVFNGLRLLRAAPERRQAMPTARTAGAEVS
ncbi:MAG: heavy metal translocating P-type ATPase, partial [Burkholderiaceae bacterium]